MGNFCRKLLGNIAILLMVSTFMGQVVLSVNAQENWIWADANGVHFRGDYYNADTNATGEIDIYNKSSVKLGSGFKYVVTKNFTKLNASLLNTGFENVDPTNNQPYNFTFGQGIGHMIEGTAADKHTGSYSLRINTTGTGSWSEIKQDIKGLSTIGEVYDKLSVWVRATVPGMYVRILIRNWEFPNYQGKELEYFSLWGGYAPLTWTEVFRSRWAWTNGKIGSSFLSITLEDYGKTGSVYFDDIGWKKYHVDEYTNSDNLASTFSTSGNAANITNSFSLQGLTVTRTYSVWKDSPKIKVTFDVAYQSNTLFFDEYIRGYVWSTSGKFLPKESYNMTDLTAETIKNLHAPGYARNFVDRYTPHILFFNNSISFVDIDNMDGWYVTLEGAGTKLEYIADTVWNHPYFNRQAFTGDLQSSLTTHSDNELRSYTFTFYVGYLINPDEYPILLRQPYGYLATWIATDHADLDRINELKALMYGSSLLNEAQPGLGFVGKGLMITKAVFPYSTSTTTGLGLNNATYLNLIRQLYKYGIEIVPHSLTNSEVLLTRTQAEQRLITMDEFSPRVWIDHGGIQVNLHNKGWMTNETNYYILDLLKAHGYEYDWSYIDLDALNLNMLWAPATPDEGFGYLQPTYMNNFVPVQKHPRASLFDLYEFNTHLGSGAYHTYKDVGGATSPSEIDQLINNKGIAILHSYMAAADWLNSNYYSIGNGQFNMTASLANNLENMRTKMYSDRKLLVMTASNWMDYILGMDSVTIEPDITVAGKFTLKNTKEVTGLSLWFRKNVNSALIDGGYTMGVVDDRIWLPKLTVGTHELKVNFGPLEPTIPHIRKDSEPFVAGIYHPKSYRIDLTGSSRPNVTISIYVVYEGAPTSILGWKTICTESQYSVSWDSTNKTLSTVIYSDGVFQFAIWENASPSTTDDYDGIWHKIDFTITLTAADDLSGVAETYYKLNDGLNKTASVDGQPFINTEGADNKLEYWSVDNAGNEEFPHKILTGIKLDSTKPAADAGVDQAINEDMPVTFNASASTDESGIQSYTWTFTDVTPQTLMGKNPTYTFEIPGTYTIALKVADLAGNTATDAVIITVLDVTKPIANAGSDQTVNEDTSVTFNASASSDNVGITAYTWTFTDVTIKTITGQKPAYTFNTPGVYAITLNVTDAAENWATDTIVITVLDITDPVAKAGQDQTVTVGEAVNFDAADSADSVGIVGHEWNFGDGATGTGVTPSHTYAAPGTYTVTLTVRDAAGNSASDTITITVRSAEPLPPPPTEAFPLWILGATAALIGIAAAAIFLWRRRK